MPRLGEMSRGGTEGREARSRVGSLRDPPLDSHGLWNRGKHTRTVPSAVKRCLFMTVLGQEISSYDFLAE